jgi:hypothetical protein
MNRSSPSACGCRQLAFKVDATTLGNALAALWPGERVTRGRSAAAATSWGEPPLCGPTEPAPNDPQPAAALRAW